MNKFNYLKSPKLMALLSIVTGGILLTISPHIHKDSSNGHTQTILISDANAATLNAAYFNHTKSVNQKKQVQLAITHAAILEPQKNKSENPQKPNHIKINTNKQVTKIFAHKPNKNSLTSPANNLYKKNTIEKQFHATHKQNVKPKHQNKPYSARLDIGAFYQNKSQSFAATDLLVPLTQSKNDLTFLDARSLVQQKSIYEQSLGLGYRHLSHHNYIVGLYGFFDHQFKKNGRAFNQITIGSEFRTKHLYLGTNGYIPLSSQTYHQRPSDIYDPKRVAMAGADAQVGWMWPKRSGLGTYLGAYYYTADNVATVIGPRATVTLDLIPIFNRPSTIFNKIELKSTVQYDKPHGTGWMVGINLSFQLGKHHVNNLSTLAMQMTDPIQTQFIHTDYQIKPQPKAKVVAPPNEPSQTPGDNSTPPEKPAAGGETPDDTAGDSSTPPEKPAAGGETPATSKTPDDPQGDSSTPSDNPTAGDETSGDTPTVPPTKPDNPTAGDNTPADTPITPENSAAGGEAPATGETPDDTQTDTPTTPNNPAAGDETSDPDQLDNPTIDVEEM